MSIDIFKKGITKIVEFYKTNHNPRSIEILFHGGEPLLWPIKKFIAAEKILATTERKEHIRFRRHIQTNITLLTERKMMWFYNHKYKISLSIDGDAIYNCNRIFKNGKPTFKQILRKIRILRKFQKRIGAVITISKYNCANPQKLYNFFKKHSINMHINFIFNHKLSASKEDKIIFLKKLIDIYLKDDPKNLDITLFDNFLNNIIFEKPVIGCEYSNEGIHKKKIFALDSNGYVYMCNRFASIDNPKEYAAFNIEKNISIEKQIKINNNQYKKLLGYFDDKTLCKGCPLSKEVCKGIGCLYTNFVNNSKDESSTLKRFTYFYLKKKYIEYKDNHVPRNC